MEECRKGLYALAVGGTAVGTGLDVPHWFADDMAKEIVLLTRKPFITAPTSLLHKVLWTACLCRP